MTFFASPWSAAMGPVRKSPPRPSRSSRPLRPWRASAMSSRISISAASAISAPARSCPKTWSANWPRSRPCCLGAVGHPDVAPGVLEKGLLLALRFRFDQYINLRPVKLFPGVETPLAGKGPGRHRFRRRPREHRGHVRRRGRLPEEGHARRGRHADGRSTPARAASAASAGPSSSPASGTRRKQLTLVAKTNVLTYGHDLWWRTFQEVAKEYPDIKPDYNHVDACCMWMVKNPEYFDVIVTTNMFGDIITDLAGILQGGMGVAAGGNINPEPGGLSMFEPMGGSAPEVHRQERHQSHRRHRGLRHAVGAERLPPGRPTGDAGRSDGHRHEDEEPGRRQDGLWHPGSRRLWSAKPFRVRQAFLPDSSFTRGRVPSERLPPAVSHARLSARKG